jgi:3-oxoacyl-(acyl-carrier-protein) synthase
MTASKEIWITGLGIISAIGNNSQECLESLQAGKSGIGKMNHLDTRHREEFVAGEINLSNKELAARCSVITDLPRTTLLALHAAKEAVAMAALEKDLLKKSGLILGTTVGGMDRTERFYPDRVSANEYIKTHPCGYCTRLVAEILGIRGYTNTISTACSSSANAIMLGSRLIKQGVADIIVAGGSDALSVFTFNGFRTLMILDPEPCRPFSADRKGLNLGEGAAFVVLESKEHAIQRNVKGMCRLAGYGNCNDAYHQTASSPDGRGPFKAMKEAIDTAGIKTSDIDYINVHGTGTDNNDLTEGIAIRKIFGDTIPDLSSTKSFTGHCLGAAGAIEAVFSVYAIVQNEVYANLRFNAPLDESNIVPVKTLKKKEVKHVLSSSFGFGGCDTSLVFSKII